MAKEQNIKIFSAADIERYHKGLMSPKERNAVEKAALDDPLLSDALEGYDLAAVNINEDLVDLKKRLETRTKNARNGPVVIRKGSFSWWKVAAMIIVIIGSGLLVYQLAFNNKPSELAQIQKNSPVNAAAKDSPVATAPSLGTTESNVRVDSTSTPLKDDGKTVENNNTPRVKETEVASALKKADTDSEGINDLSDEKSEKSPAPASEALDKNKEASVASRAPGFDESKTKNRKSDSPAAVAADAEYKQAESQSKAANAIPQARGFNSNGRSNQSNVFRGKVTDNNNNALPFSNITNLTDNIGTYSDARGNFVLTSPDSVLTVQIRSIGFETTNAQLHPTSRENRIQLEGDKSISPTVLDTVKRNTNRSLNSNMTFEEPEPADGWSNYDTYLANNLKTPESYKVRQQSGTVELTFDVDKNGIPYNIVVKRSLCESCDKEAIRLIKEGPKWKRKAKKGKATVTVSF